MIWNNIKGSPPPMRGKEQRTGRCAGSIRITPAYAGKSVAVAVLHFVQRDHPRLCGEKFDMMKTTGKVKGSPPPMRGKAEHFPPEIMRHRITPAYAGKSEIVPCFENGIKDHPRLCGEKGNKFLFEKFAQGSPPPMRGKD